MDKRKEHIFDVKLFKRLFQYIKPYKGVFFGLLILVVFLAAFSAATPYITKYAIDDSIAGEIIRPFYFTLLSCLPF